MSHTPASQLTVEPPLRLGLRVQSGARSEFDGLPTGLLLPRAPRPPDKDAVSTSEVKGVPVSVALGLLGVAWEAEPATVSATSVALTAAC